MRRKIDQRVHTQAIYGNVIHKEKNEKDCIKKEERMQVESHKEKDGEENLAFRYLYGFGILFVVLSHCDGGGVEMLSNWMHFGAFHLGIFVFGSGYFFNGKSIGRPMQYLWRKIKTLLIPLWCWNLFYGLVMALLHLLGFSFGEKLSFTNLILFPVNSENLYLLNMGSWFIFPFFCVQILYGMGKALLDTLGKPMITDRFLQAFFAAAGFAGVYLAGHVFHEYDLYPVFRILYFMPFYVCGILYKDFGEKVFCRIPAAVYLASCLFVSLMLNAFFGKTVYAIPSSCDYPFGVFATYLSGIVGILFWLEISRLLSEYGKPCGPLLMLGRSTWDIMLHQFMGIMGVKAVFALLSRLTGAFSDFDMAAFLSDIWYLYRPKGISEFALLYVLGAFGASLLIKNLLRKGKRQWEKLVKGRASLWVRRPWEKKVIY